LSKEPCTLRSKHIGTSMNLNIHFDQDLRELLLIPESIDD